MEVKEKIMQQLEGTERAEVLFVVGCGVSREPPGRQNCWSGQHVSEDSKDQDRE